MPSSPPATLQILGGGPAGLAVAWYARRAGLSVRLFEATSRVGGLCSTKSERGFSFDTGAHRLHDRIPSVTANVRELLAGALHRCTAPSRILHRLGRIDFPITPMSLLSTVGPRIAARMTLDWGRARLAPPESPGARSFEQLARARYGDTVARELVLGYSEKLWGASPSSLCASVAGGRLEGLDLSAIVAGLRGSSEVGHLDGAFLYPRGGFGRITEALARGQNRAAIELDSPVTLLSHRGGRIREVVAGGRAHPARYVVSTLPLPTLARCLDPLPPPSVVEACRALSFRSVVCVALFIDRPSIGEEATLYVADPNVPVTRLVEPRNRCPTMAPPGRTSLVAELPCQRSDDTWALDDAALTAMVAKHVEEMGLARQREIIGGTVHRMTHAYPILSLASREALRRIAAWLEGLDNLQLVGRAGTFRYQHLHDIMADARDLVGRLVRSPQGFDLGDQGAIRARPNKPLSGSAMRHARGV